MGKSDYRTFFAAACGAGQVPYPYQERLACGEPFPELVDVPTGLGRPRCWHGCVEQFATLRRRSSQYAAAAFCGVCRPHAPLGLLPLELHEFVTGIDVSLKQ